MYFQKVQFLGVFCPFLQIPWLDFYVVNSGAPACFTRVNCMGSLMKLKLQSSLVEYLVLV